MDESLDYVNKWIYNAAGCVPSMQYAARRRTDSPETYIFRFPDSMMVERY